MVKLAYGVRFMNHEFVFVIYFRPNEFADTKYLVEKYNLILSNGNNEFGRGDSYRILKDTNLSSDFVTKSGNYCRYFFSDWASFTSYDIANFLFEINFDNDFNGIIFSATNLWIDYVDDENKPELNVQYINECRIKRVKESILFQILYELMTRISFQKQ
jgi:hypothetical protein